jgi:hypothetical protein
MVQGLVRLILVQLELYNNYILGYRAGIATFYQTVIMFWSELVLITSQLGQRNIV